MMPKAVLQSISIIITGQVGPGAMAIMACPFYWLLVLVVTAVAAQSNNST